MMRMRIDRHTSSFCRPCNDDDDDDNNNSHDTTRQVHFFSPSTGAGAGPEAEVEDAEDPQSQGAYQAVRSDFEASVQARVRVGWGSVIGIVGGLE
jgi:hypothetical protein